MALALTSFGSLRAPNRRSCRFVTPWPPFQISELGRIPPVSIPPKSPQVPIWCPLRRGTNQFYDTLNVCFRQERSFNHADIQRCDGQQSTNSGQCSTLLSVGYWHFPFTRNKVSCSGLIDKVRFVIRRGGPFRTRSRLKQIVPAIEP